MILVEPKVFEPEDNKAAVTLKIAPDDREWVKDEQRRIKKREGAEPTHAQLFSRLRQAYESTLAEGHNPSQESQIGSPPALESSTISVNLIRLLESAVDDQDEDALKTVEEYLEFSANRRKRGKIGGPKGGRSAKKA